MSAIRFEVLARDPATGARAGLLHTPHGPVATPAFVPVGTQGTVKAATPADLAALGVELVMCNAYHLAMRPGAETVRALGGLHRLAAWDAPLMTDSGGFQVFSLAERRKVTDDGVTFRSHVDGNLHHFTPESVVALQEALGADLAMPLDVCTPYPADRADVERDLARTQAWLERAVVARRRADQALYGIVQGGLFPDLRAEAARAVVALEPEGYAVGGVSVGETQGQMLAAVAATVAELPQGAPRHLLGVGHPDDLVPCIALGIDTFDCVLPTRLARNAAALTPSGRISLRHAAYRADTRPIQAGCDCYACRNFSRGAIRHFVKADEILAAQLLTLHNLAFTVRRVAAARAAILAGAFDDFRRSLASAARAEARLTPAA
jgi:queuine tRNA-ribosyltransferase